MMTADESSRQAPADARAVVTRFAPSPTGALHLGHAASAVTAHGFARARGGRFLLRIEDIDGARSRAGHVDGILADLRWLGLTWDGAVVFQSQRQAIYDAALERLRSTGLLYRCWCTRAEIAAAASAPHRAEPVYPGTCRGRTNGAGPCCWRLDMAKAVERAVVKSGPLRWTDHGVIVPAEPTPFGDVVLARKDAPSSYHLAVTLDDAAQGVSDVVRGRDLFSATHVHRLLQALLGLPTPAYHHHPLILGPDGTRLAKRSGAPTLAGLRAAGVDGPGLTATLATGQFSDLAAIGFAQAKH